MANIKIPHGIIVAENIAVRGWDAFDPETMANYSADFFKDEKSDISAAFINVKTNTPGEKYGYVVMHYFLEEVGVGNRFISNDMTPAGKALFDSLEKDGVIKPVEDYKNEPIMGRRLTYPHMYEVVSDPTENLQKWARGERTKAMEQDTGLKSAAETAAGMLEAISKGGGGASPEVSQEIPPVQKPPRKR